MVCSSSWGTFDTYYPLTQYEVLDHSDRSAWMGKPVPLDLTRLPEYVDKVPLQYPELGLGYSAPN